MDLHTNHIMTKQESKALLGIDGKYSREMAGVTTRRLMRNLPIVQNRETLHWRQHDFNE